MADQAGERKQVPQGGGRAAKMMPGEKARDFKGTILKLMSYLKPYRIQLCIVFLTAILSTVFAIISPTILGMATDEVVQGVAVEQRVGRVHPAGYRAEQDHANDFYSIRF